MTDRELLDALLVIARRAGLLDTAQHLIVADGPDVPQCLKRCPGIRGLLCIEPREHAGQHSWERGNVGRVALASSAEGPCMRVSLGTQDERRRENRRYCLQPRGHEGSCGPFLLKCFSQYSGVMCVRERDHAPGHVSVSGIRWTGDGVPTGDVRGSRIDPMPDSPPGGPHV